MSTSPCRIWKTATFSTVETPTVSLALSGDDIPYPSSPNQRSQRSNQELRTKSAVMLSSSTCTTSHTAATPADSAPCLRGCAQGALDTESSIQVRMQASCSWIPAATSTFGLEQMARIRGKSSTRFRRSRIRQARKATHCAMTCPCLGRIFHR